MNTNPTFINSANVDYFGFLATFNPFAKSLKFDISTLTTFKSGGEANIDSITFVVKDSNGNTYNGAIDPSNSETECTITGLESGVLYFGVYNIVATLTEPATSDEDEQTYVIELNPNVCYDEKLNNSNLAQGCLLVDVNCNNATMVIKEGANIAYAGKTIVSKSYQATVNYPIDAETQEPFLPPKAISYLPYSLYLTDSVTGTYSIVNITTVNYDLDNNCVLAIQYRSNINQDVTCGNGMCEITCCMIEAVDTIERGGAKGVQMKELYAEALVYYSLAEQLSACGKNNTKYVQKVKEILNCDCKCTSKSQLIQPNPITFQNKNLIQSCGTTITEDENGDLVIKSFVYKIEEAEGEDKISFEVVQTDACTKTTYVTLHCDKIERCIYNILSTNVDILNEWKTLFGVGCACDGVDVTADIKEYYIYTDLEMDSLETHYFSRNENVLASYYDLTINITGGTIKSVSLYSNLLNNGTTLLAPISTPTHPVIPTSICASNMIGKMNHPAGEIYQILLNVNTECGCDVPFVFDEYIQRVLYSERYELGYRFNPQIENPPIVTSYEVIDGEYYTNYEVIFADSYYNSLSGSSGSVIRSMKIKMDSSGNYSLDETRTLFGVKGIGTIATQNAIWGNQAVFDYASSIVLDQDEIVNGYPVMYFCTFGGAVCRAVRERNTECNETANWKIYRIAGAKNVASGGHLLYGTKKWMTDENGNPTFLIVDNTSGDVKILYLDVSVGTNKNLSANWKLDQVFTLSGSNMNIQIFDDRIFALGVNQIYCHIYTGTNSIADLINNASYGVHSLFSGSPTIPATTGSSPVFTCNGYLDGAGDVANCDNPLSMWKEGSKYYFSNARLATQNGQNARGSYVRYFEFSEGAYRPQDYTFHTEIVANSGSNLEGGTWVSGVSSNTNGESFGMVFISGIGWVSPYFHGFRIFDFTAKEAIVFSGQAVVGGDLDDTQTIMDSQWDYNVT